MKARETMKKKRASAVMPVVRRSTPQSRKMLSHTLPAGFVVKIEGVPFLLAKETEIYGLKRNMVAANLLMDTKDCG